MSLSSTTQCTREVFTFLTGHSPDTWVSKSTLSRWNKEVAELAIIENLPNSTSTFASYGILADESTRGDKKIFLVCVAHWNTIKEEPIITILSMKDLDCCTSTNLECSRNVPEGYLHKWKTFLEFLLNEKVEYRNINNERVLDIWKKCERLQQDVDYNSTVMRDIELHYEKQIKKNKSKSKSVKISDLPIIDGGINMIETGTTDNAEEKNKLYNILKDNRMETKKTLNEAERLLTSY
ncbi:2721_t:CDS:2 [Entrophospora sp. SA101]|nr:2721_t:CDS:2 [Entrophospora sp. SA101]